MQRPTGNHLTPVPNKLIQQLWQTEQFWLIAGQRNQINAKHSLHLCMSIKIVEHDIGRFSSPELYYHPHSLLVGFVPQRRNALKALTSDQQRNLLEQPRFVNLIRQFSYNNSGWISIRRILYTSAGTHIDLATSSLISIEYSTTAIDQTGSREIWPRQEFH